jgi:uncharacterized membrane protein HdeD (DUF308 family)
MTRADFAGEGPHAAALLLEAADNHRGLLRWRGLAAIAFAFLAFFWPRLTLPGLTMVWAGYSLVDGLLAIAAAIRGRIGTPRAWLSLIGMAGIACAGAAVVRPEMVAEHLVVVICIWVMFTGAMQAWAALKLRKAIDGGWILVLDGTGAMLFGVALAFWPRLEMVPLVWLVGWFAALLGSLYLGVAVWLSRSR